MDAIFGLVQSQRAKNGLDLTWRRGPRCNVPPCASNTLVLEANVYAHFHDQAGSASEKTIVIKVNIIIITMGYHVPVGYMVTGQHLLVGRYRIQHRQLAWNLWSKTVDFIAASVRAR
jgi:hypothetical protein